MGVAKRRGSFEDRKKQSSQTKAIALALLVQEVNRLVKEDIEREVKAWSMMSDDEISLSEKRLEEFKSRELLRDAQMAEMLAVFNWASAYWPI